MRNHWIAVLLLGVAALSGCGDDDDTQLNKSDAGHDAGYTPGVCDLAICPQPSLGVACCTPDARCGTDPGVGICVANSGQPSPNVCTLSECELPPVGLACCLPNGRCGRDPWAVGACFPNPPPVNVDASVPPLCDIESCDPPAEGIACCLPTGKCGVDYTGLGFCVLPPVDGGVTMPPDGPPDHPSITGECPSFIGGNGLPVWGCCSRFGVCGTFAYNSCLLPIGAQIPVPANDGQDAGIANLCTPPAP